MKITVTLTDLDAADLTALSEFMERHDRTMAAADADIAAEKSAEVSPVVTMSTEDLEPAPAKDDVLGGLIAETDAQYSRTDTVTIKAGNKGKADTEVLTDDGRLGVIEACYRGRAIVSFEDGSAEVLGGSTLALAPQGDEDPAETPEDAPEAKEPTETGSRRSRRQKAEEPASPRDVANALIYQIEKQDGGKESVLELLREFDETATGLDALTDEEVEEVIPELKEMIA